MNEFFKFLIRFSRGWRRKTGLSLLVMTLLATVGWMRSFTTLDKVSIPISQSESIEVSSLRSKFCLMRRSEPRNLSWESSRFEQASDHYMSYLSADWSLHIFGLRMFSNLDVFLVKTVGIVVPYWIPVLLLTLNSFWLLLSTVKKSKHKKSTETAPNE